MSHQLVAAVWDLLEGRHDVANILREVVGQHVTDLAMLQLQEDLIAHIEPLMRIVAWIKTIFDLQRSYLQATTGADELHPYLAACLIPSDLVFSTLMYLIQVKSRLFPSGTMTIREFSKHRYFIAQTLLSGLRLLLLRNECLSAEKKHNMERAINSVWQHPRLSPVEQFVVSELIPEAIDALRSSEPPGSHYASPDQHSSSIPTFTAGLYPLILLPERFLPGAFDGLSRDGPGRISSYWTVFDALWAAEGALVQCHADRRHLHTEHEDPGAITLRADEMLEQIEENRRTLLAAVFEISETEEYPLPPPILESFASTLLGWYEEESTYFGPNFARHLIDMKADFENSMRHFVGWLNNRKLQLRDCNGENEALAREFHRSLREWVHHAETPGAEDRRHEEDYMPIYVVNCPALHPVPKKLLAEKLRWSDKCGYEELMENSTVLSLDITCPRCPGSKIQCARLVEPLELLAGTLRRSSDDDSSSRYSFRAPDSFSTSRSGALSHSTSLSSTRIDSTEPPMTPLSGVLTSSSIANTIMEPQKSPEIDVPLSPLSPGLLNPNQLVPSSSIGSSAASSSRDDRQVLKEPIRERVKKASPDPAKKLSPDPPKPFAKIGRRHTFMGRRASSSSKEKEKEATLPTTPSFAFSASGSSLLFWPRNGQHLVRFDLYGDDSSITECCRYDVPGIQYAAAGDTRCLIVASDGECRKLITLNGLDTEPEAQLDINPVRRNLQGGCIAVSHNDEFAAVALDDQIQIYQISNRRIRSIMSPEHSEAYSMTGGLLSQHNVPVPRTPSLTSQKRALSWKEAAQEAQRQNAVIERKLWFSPNNEKLIVATHLGDHYVYLDVWDVTKEPCTITSDYSRSFKLPPWTTNDGDLTCIFYDNLHRAAFLTAFLGKEYPLLIPIPGYDELTNETFGTKVVHAAQSPSGSRFLTANGMMEMYLFEYRPNGTLSPRKLKKATAKMSSLSFKPGQLALAMPAENVALAFWVKDSAKLVLRTIRIGDSETYKDVDLRLHYDRAVKDFSPASAESRFVFRKPSGSAPGSGSLAEMPSLTPLSELPARSSIQELPGTRSISELPGE